MTLNPIYAWSRCTVRDFFKQAPYQNILSLPLTLYDFEFLCIYKRITKEKIKNIFFCGRHEDLAVWVLHI